MNALKLQFYKIYNVCSYYKMIPVLENSNSISVPLLLNVQPEKLFALFVKNKANKE